MNILGTQLQNQCKEHLVKKQVLTVSAYLRPCIQISYSYFKTDIEQKF
jgi:hypothetical protein